MSTPNWAKGNNWKNIAMANLEKHLSAVKKRNQERTNIIEQYLRSMKSNYAIMGGKAAVHYMKPFSRIRSGSPYQSTDFDIYVPQGDMNKITRNMKNLLVNTNQVTLKIKNGHKVVQIVPLNNSGRKKIDPKTGTYNSIMDIHESKSPMKYTKGSNGLKYIKLKKLIEEQKKTIADKGPKDPKYSKRSERLQTLSAVKILKKRVK
jgi:hypothetical protein